MHTADNGVAGATAWCAVTEIAKVTPDDRVLILGAGATEARGGVPGAS